MMNTNPGVAGAPEVDMIKSYGSITLETICAVKLAYIFTLTRLGQDNRLLYKCLMSTLTKAARHKVSIKEQDYQADNPNNEGIFKKSGELRTMDNLLINLVKGYSTRSSITI